jgi:hypothetical protein
MDVDPHHISSESSSTDAEELAGDTSANGELGPFDVGVTDAGKD